MSTLSKDVPVLSEKKSARKNEKGKVPFPILFGEIAESITTLRRGIELFDDPTTVNHTAARGEDASTDSA